MDKSTEKALMGSIKKWEKIILGESADNGIDDCPLCIKFHSSYSETENGGCSDLCPVKARTKADFCRRSPYRKWMDAYRTEMEELAGARPVSEVPAVIGPKTHKAAYAEYDFLVSLLPEA